MRLPAQNGAARAQVEEVLKGLGRSHGLGPVAISPDGALLAYVRRSKTGSELVLAPFSDPARTTRITAAKKEGAPCGDTDPAWAADSRRLAFLSDCQSDGQQDVFVAAISGDLTGGKPKIEIQRLTEAKGEVGYPEFSPDGSRIAFLYVEGATRAAGALAAMKPWAGVIGEDGIEIQRVGLVDANEHKSAAPTFATPAKLHVYEFDWSPDSKSLAYVAADPPGENNWWVAKLYTQALDAEPKSIFAPSESTGALHGLQIAVPRWSPDGQSIAFIGGLMSDQGSTGGDVWLIPSNGGEPRNLTPDRKTSAAWIAWGDSSLFVSEQSAGNSQLVSLQVPGSGGEAIASQPVFSIPASVGDGRMMMSLSATKDRSTFVFTANSLDHPAEVYAAKTGQAATSLAELHQLTHVNDGIQPTWGKAESLTWKNEGFDVQGWLLYPAHFDPAKKYGLIVLVHGGPAAAAGSSWGGRGSLSAPAFSAMDYFVLEPNPRGSYGQGEAFTAANRKDFGYGDLRDILAGVDAVTTKIPAVDPHRVGLTGWSYGGFMTMFAVTQTQRFKAAVAGAGISDWKSYYGENSIDQWMTPYFGASVYKDPAVYAKSSAIDFIDKVRTPTLAVVGDRDGECPAPQSFEFWHALRDEHVPTQLVVYPNEGHGFANPDHRTDVLVRTLNWFAKYMPAGE
ncbi:S9 family peptidase [Acidicapsa acidisoli]|uniref:S9 family peptidase n=1 Tax=Acidicapsa acidisoli TaxID=1615681 RepID=UPI0021E0B0FA|nr:S9 family peptidase [Acidicapsa acidisoli]